MFRLIITFLLVIVVLIGAYTYHLSEKTFEAKFKNIDGLPKYAKVAFLGVKVGEVIRTKPISDGIVVTVRIKKKDFTPAPGFLLTITSFSPGQGRILEIVPPESNLPDTKSWVVQEPVTTESWLHASLGLLEGLKAFSESIIKHVTPENFEAARKYFSSTSELLNQTVKNLYDYNVNLIEIKNKFSDKSTEVNKLLIQLKKTINSLNKIIADKNLTTSFKDELNDITGNLNKISSSLTKPEFLVDVKSFKTNILDYLNDVNASLTANDAMIKNPELLQKIKTFNIHVTNLNNFYDSLNKKDIKKISEESLKKAKEVTTILEEKTSEVLRQPKLTPLK